MVQHFTAEPKDSKVYLFASHMQEDCCKHYRECLSKKEKAKVKEKGIQSIVSVYSIMKGYKTTKKWRKTKKEKGKK